MSARRRPNYGRFLITGVFAGLVAAFVITQLAPPSRQYERADVFLYVGLLAGLVGGLLGGAVAVLLDRAPDRPAGNAPTRPRWRERGRRTNGT